MCRMSATIRVPMTGATLWITTRPSDGRSRLTLKPGVKKKKPGLKKKQGTNR